MYKRQALQIVPGGFPNTIIQKCREVTRIEPRETLLSEFPDVLSDELSPEPMKTDAPMHIHIKEGATPKKVTTARCVPLRYECEAEKTVQELIKKGVIVPTNETTDWCSPAFFVPKGDKIRVRLVTDYTELNKHVKAKHINMMSEASSPKVTTLNINCLLYTSPSPRD